MPPRHVNPGQAGNSAQPGHAANTSPDPASASPGAPGYFPRLLSAAAHVTHAASDSALERFGLNRNSFTLLTRLAEADDAVPGTVLAEGTGQPLPAVRQELASLASSGYAELQADAAGGTAGSTGPAVDAWAVTDAGRKVIECARLAAAEITLDAEDSQELRKALRSLIASLGAEQPDR